VKILHLPFGYFPDVCGGTEVYVAALCRELSVLGHQVVVAAPGNRLEENKYEDVPVYRYPVNGDLPDSIRSGEGDPGAVAHVGDILDQIKPDIVHLHALTSGVSLLVLREAAKRDTRTVLTYHTPTVSCVQGTLLYKGREVCDGVLDEARCTACSLTCLGLPEAVSKGLVHLPEYTGRWFARIGFSGRWLTALRRKEMVSLRHKTVRQIFAEVDHVIALCDWTEKLLQRNRLGVDKTSIIRHGLPHKVESSPAQQIDVPEAFSEKQPLRLLYLGRISPEKGVDIIVQAMNALPADAPVTLDIFCLQQDAGEFVQGVLKQVENDSRITLHPPVSPDEVIPLMRGFHVLLVPSQWLETGPFVVLEALSSKTPVVGSWLGGIGEQVKEGVSGLLLDDYRQPSAWQTAIEKIVTDPALVSRLRRSIESPQGFDAVARSHDRMYGALNSNSGNSRDGRQQQ